MEKLRADNYFVIYNKENFKIREIVIDNDVASVNSYLKKNTLSIIEWVILFIGWLPDPITGESIEKEKFMLDFIVIPPYEAYELLDGSAKINWDSILILKWKPRDIFQSTHNTVRTDENLLSEIENKNSEIKNKDRENLTLRAKLETEESEKKKKEESLRILELEKQELLKEIDRLKENKQELHNEKEKATKSEAEAKKQLMDNLLKKK